MLQVMKDIFRQVALEVKFLHANELGQRAGANLGRLFQVLGCDTADGTTDDL